MRRGRFATRLRKAMRRLQEAGKLTPDEVDKCEVVLQPEFLPEFKEQGSIVVRCPLPWLSAEALELQQKLEEEATRYAKEHFCAPRDFVEGSASELPCPKDAAQVRWAVTKEARVEVAEEQVEQAMIDGQRCSRRPPKETIARKSKRLSACSFFAIAEMYLYDQNTPFLFVMIHC